ncbi:MAG: hypothetical protein M3R14_16910 [Acidobacteriota bacterium]|nr:hypothetical protein [Acidobacteriota bacterium]
MKKQILKAIGGASLAILVLAVFAQSWVSAENKGSESLQTEPSLVGSWNVQVSIRDCHTGMILVTFPAMITYNQGGTMQETANDAAPLLRLPGHGVWSQHNGRRYSNAFQFFRFNPDGTFAGRNIIRGAISLGQSGNEYTTTDTVGVFDANGNLIVTACATSTATRFE